MMGEKTRIHPGGEEGPVLTAETRQPVCPDCSFDLTTKIVRIESDDDELYPLTGLYCPRCLLLSFVEVTEDIDDLLDEVDFIRLQAEVEVAAV